MNMPKLANCSRCNRVFSQTNTDKCPACIDYERELLSTSRGLLRRSRSQGGIRIEDLAVAAGSRLEDIESLYHQGLYGTDVDILMVHCPRCAAEVRASECEGYFCHPCAEALKGEMGSEMLSLEQLDEQQRAERERLAMLQDHGKNRYGFQKNKAKDDWQFYKF